MNSHIFQSYYKEINDIIFENKNKKYGAYELRRTNIQRHWYSFAAGLFLYFGSMIAFYLWLNVENDFNAPKTQNQHYPARCCYCDGDINIALFQPKYTLIDFKENQVSFPHPIIKPVLKPKFIKVNSQNFFAKKLNIFSKNKMENYLVRYSDIETDISEELKIAYPLDSNITSYQYYKDSEGNRTPKFNNDMQGINDFMNQNLKFPKEAFLNCIKGTILIQFTLERDGSFSNINLLNKLGFGLDQEALRLIKLMPKWQPAYKNWKKVKSKITIPILFLKID